MIDYSLPLSNVKTGIQSRNMEGGTEAGGGVVLIGLFLMA